MELPGNLSITIATTLFFVASHGELHPERLKKRKRWWCVPNMRLANQTIAHSIYDLGSQFRVAKICLTGNRSPEP
jgi:hypothetical protein